MQDMQIKYNLTIFHNTNTVYMQTLITQAQQNAYKCNVIIVYNSTHSINYYWLKQSVQLQGYKLYI